SPSALRHMNGGFAYRSPYSLGHGLPSPCFDYLPASPLALTYYRIGSRPHRSTGPPKGTWCRLGRLTSPDSILAALRRYGNINPLSIDYACRPRLRSRLTQGGLTWPWNPWSFGGRGSHPSFATHACILTRVASTTRSPCRFTPHTTLPYPLT